MDIMNDVIVGIEDRDHKIFVVKPGEQLAYNIWEQMEADGYKFRLLSDARQDHERAEDLFRAPERAGAEDVTNDFRPAPSVTNDFRPRRMILDLG